MREPDQTAPTPPSNRGMVNDTKNLTPALAVRGIDEAARMIGLGRRTTWQLINADALPHRRVGRALVFIPAELQAWLDADCPTDPGSAARVRLGMRKGTR